MNAVVTSFESLHPLAGQLPSSDLRWGPKDQTTFAAIVKDAVAADWAVIESFDDVAVVGDTDVAVVTVPLR